MDIFSKHITDRDEKHCGCGERGRHGAYTGSGYEDYRGYSDYNDSGSHAECRSCDIFNGLSESRSSCSCGSNTRSDSRVFEGSRVHGSCSCEESRSSESCSCEVSQNHGSCSCEESQNHGSCSCEESRNYGSCSCEESQNHGSCSCEVSQNHGSCSCEESRNCGCDTYEESGCCDTYEESRSCGSCGTYGNNNYSGCNTCTEHKSCDISCGGSCGIYVHCDSCSNECDCKKEKKDCDCGCRKEHNDCGCGKEYRSCDCAQYDRCNESNRCNTCSRPKGSCDCGNYGGNNCCDNRCTCKEHGDGRQGISGGLEYSSFSGFSSHLGIKCYEKVKLNPKKCRKRGKLRCRCNTDVIQKGICGIKKGLESSQRGYKEICCGNFFEGQKFICEAIDEIRKGLGDFNKGLPDIQPCVTCDEWRRLYMGVCHIDAGLKAICKGNEELKNHCYDTCGAEEIKQGICSLEEGLKKITKALIAILY